MHLFKNSARHFLPLAVLVTLISGIIYIVAQQSYRMSANDPQVQMAQDVARALEGGATIETLVAATKIDIGRSLAPFIVVYDDKGAPIGGNALLNGQLPEMPPGVFAYTREHNENRITWQPEPGIRHAVVIERVSGANPGFVMAGRSLREVEGRIDLLTMMVGIGWAGTVIATFVAIMLVELIFRDRR